MLTSVLKKLSNQLPLQQINEDFTIPRTYISNIARNGNKLVLNINNTTATTNATLQLAIRKNENDPTTNIQKVDVTLLPNASTHVELDIKDIFENDVNLFVEGKLEDLAYTNDGNWNYSLSNKSSEPNSFVINNNAAVADTSEFHLFRNVSINVNTPDYVSIYKMMKAGGLSRDLSSYTNLLFNVGATGAGQLKIVLQKASVTNWSDQYSYTLPISADAKDYIVKLKDFVSATNNEALIADDIVTITFSFISSGGNNITASLNNVRFNHIDYVYESSLSDKSVNVYPNPVKDNFTCTFKSDKQVSVTLQLIVIGSGRVVLTKAVDVVKGINNISVQVNRTMIKQGQYVLMIASEGERYTPFKLQMRQY